MRGNPRELEGEFRADDMNPVASAKGSADLAIDDQGHSFGRFVHRQRVSPIGSIDQRSITESVGIEWSDDEGLQVLAYDGASGRETVCGRADRGADDHSIAAVGRHFFAVDFEPHVEHRQAGTGRNRHFVHPGDRFGCSFGRFMLTLEHQVFGDRVLSIADGRQAVAELFDREIGEEPESTKVDSEDRSLSGGQLTAGSQNRTVSAEDHHEIGVRGNRFEILGHRRRQYLDTSLPLEKFGQLGPRILNTSALIASEYDEFEF